MTTLHERLAWPAEDGAREPGEHSATDSNRDSAAQPVMGRHPVRKSYAFAVAVALVLVISLSSCSDDDKPEADRTSAATPTQNMSPTPTTQSAEDKAAKQLDSYLKVRDAALRKREVNLKDLNKVATSDEFLLAQSKVVGLVRGNVTVTGRYTHTLADARNRGQTILITDCEDRTNVTYKVNGAIRKPDFTDPEGNPLRNPAPVEYTLVRDKGSWKVSDSDLKWDQPC